MKTLKLWKLLEKVSKSVNDEKEISIQLGFAGGLVAKLKELNWDIVV